MFTLQNNAKVLKYNSISIFFKVNNLMKNLFLLPLLILTSLCFAQQKSANFMDSADAYLGQSPPNDTPKIFAPGMLAEKGCWAGDRVAFSPDGKEFYYSHNTDWFSNKNHKLEYMKYTGGKWTGPFVLSEHYYAPTISADGQTMYLIGGPNKTVGAIAWKAHRSGDTWTQPEAYIYKPYGLYDFTQINNGAVYIGTNGNWGPKSNWATYNISTLNVSGKDTLVKSLGVPLNAPGFNGDFFIAPDDSYMILSAKERPSFECELFISFHKKDGSWTNPKSLGPLINNDIAHRWGEYVSPDGKYLFYTHGHSAQSWFIYWVRFDTLLERLKHNNYEPYVKNNMPDQSVPAGKAMVFKIPENTFMDDDGNDTLFYEAGLANGQPLPDGLTFDADKKQISGTPKIAGSYIVKVTALDTSNEATSGYFILKVL
jgi:hypothetical protein